MKFFRRKEPRHVLANRQFEGYVDSISPLPGPDGTREIVMLGWALDHNEEIQGFFITINKGLPSETRETAQYGLPRADVRSAFPKVAHASVCGFRVLFRGAAFELENIKSIEGTSVFRSGEILTRAFSIPAPKANEDRLAAVELPSKQAKLFGFLDNVSPCYIGEGSKGLVVRGWIAHAEKRIVGLAFVAEQAGQRVPSADVIYGLEHPDLVELLRDLPQGGRAGFRAVFKNSEFKTDDIVSFHASVSLEGGDELETTFPLAVVPRTLTTLIQGHCLPMTALTEGHPLPMRGGDKPAASSDFCFGNLRSVQKVWLGKGRIGYYIDGWLLAPEMRITDVWLQAGERSCDIFHFGYPHHGLEKAYPTEKGSKGWFSGLLQSADWHINEIACRMTAHKENGKKFFLEFPARPVDRDFYHPASDHERVISEKAIGVHQCFYDDQSKARLDPGFIPYFNQRTSRFFENDVIVELIREKAHTRWDYFGVFSWRFSEKVPLRSEIIFELMKENGYESDVYTFFEGTHSGLGEAGYNTWTYGECSHPGLIEAGEALLNRLGLRVDLRQLAAPIIYQNHFICRSGLYERYVRELLEPAIRTMSDINDREIQDLIGRDAQYIGRSNTADRLTQVFGRPYFSLEPFICERLFSTWAALQSLKVRHIFCAKIPGS